MGEKSVTIKDLAAAKARWCDGCGDFSIIQGVKKCIVENNLDPHNVVNVSGIGCSGRAPHYINTYGINGIHGRAATIATGLSLVKPELSVFVHSGDGDALSIGGNHLLHGINKNVNCVYIMYDNAIYSLTKMQTSPTTQKGRKTNTQPQGTLLDPLNVLRFAVGVEGSFVASTADWLPAHLNETIAKAHAHKGFSFVHVHQRCPHFITDGLDHTKMDLFTFLTNDTDTDGISIPKNMVDKVASEDHDPRDIGKAFWRASDDHLFLGLIYYNPDKPVYNDLIDEQVTLSGNKTLDDIIDLYAI
jgi:2-oxoglutarate/2-oxoacid ferredoxin oxidoreductase subunit beta